MNRLLDIGFEPAGRWLLESGHLRFELTRHSTRANILYAFASVGRVMYVGKSARTLAERMVGYRSPGESQVTNIVNSRRIVETLRSGAALDILALPDNGLLHYGPFHLNLAAALEDDIIRLLAPPWNGSKADLLNAVTPASSAAVAPTRPTHAPPAAPIALPISASFTFVLQPTYYAKGFFNVGVDAQRLIGADGETIELFLGDDAIARTGTINRRANPNETPRIMGGVTLQRWFVTQATQMARIKVDVMSPTSIRLRVT